MNALVKLLAVGGLAASALAVTMVFRHDQELAYDRVAEGGLIAETGCGPIEYAVEGRGLPVFVVHGSGGGYDQGIAFGMDLAAAGYRVIAMSRFGYLRTPMPVDASVEAQADAHACLMDALGIDRVAIIGASAGAPSALEFAIRNPERTRALVLLVPALWAPNDGAQPAVHPAPATEAVFGSALRSDFLYWAARRVAGGVLTRALLATDPALVASASREERARVDAILDNIFPVKPRRLGLLNDASIVGAAAPQALDRVTAPTLVIGVKDDLFGTWVPAAHTAAAIAGARLVSYPSGGHVWVGHHAEIMKEIAAFLADARNPRTH